MSPKITPDHLGRGAVVYVRQSTAGQVLENTESQRRQYALTEAARSLGFASVAVIDDDLGRSGSGLVERPGFQKLVASVCTGSIGAVFCIEASRLARNGRDWHYLIELCALVGSLVIDPEGGHGSDPGYTRNVESLGWRGSGHFRCNPYTARFEPRRSMQHGCGQEKLVFRYPIIAVHPVISERFISNHMMNRQTSRARKDACSRYRMRSSHKLNSHIRTTLQSFQVWNTIN